MKNKSNDWRYLLAKAYLGAVIIFILMSSLSLIFTPEEAGDVSLGIATFIGATGLILTLVAWIKEVTR
jgi:hypothetical protein